MKFNHFTNMIPSRAPADLITTEYNYFATFRGDIDECWFCNGTGEVSSWASWLKGDVMTEPCNMCHGTGKESEQDICPVCGQRGAWDREGGWCGGCMLMEADNDRS